MCTEGKSPVFSARPGKLHVTNAGTGVSNSVANAQIRKSGQVRKRSRIVKQRGTMPKRCGKKCRKFRPEPPGVQRMRRTGVHGMYAVGLRAAGSAAQWIYSDLE